MKLVFSAGSYALLLCLHLSVFCQSPIKRPLHIGDTLPDILLHNVINYTGNSVNTSEFGSELMILDFWNLRCGNCIASFPKLDSLQKLFAGKIQILMVNKESKESTIAFFKKFKHIKMPDLPFVTGDTILQGFFPTESFPSHVWIDKVGKVLYITSGYNTTKENIEGFLGNENLQLKNISRSGIKHGPHISHLYSNWKDVTLYFSSITRCRDSFNVQNDNPSGFLEEATFRISSNCASILDLYLMAYNGKVPSFGKPYNTELHVADGSKYQRPTDPNLWDAWMVNNAYSYELILNSKLFDDRFRYMQKDLMRTFGLNVYREKRKIKGLTLKISNSPPGYKPSEISRVDNYFDFISGKSNVWIFENMRLSVFLNRLKNKIEVSRPFESKADPRLLVSFSIPYEIWNADNDFDTLSKHLEKYGLFLQEEFIDTEVLVIEENTSEISLVLN